MNSPRIGGLAPQQQVTNQNALNSSGLCDAELRAWVALEWNALKEMIPGPLLSDEAAKLYVDMLTAIAVEVGQMHFHRTILKAIETCDRRPTIAMFRKLAGLNGRLDVHQEATAKAWELITHIVSRHIGRDGEGNCQLKTWLERTDGGVFIEHRVPEMSVATRRAVAALGGWAALVESRPTFWSQKFQMFREIYRPDPSDMFADQAHETRLSAGREG